MIHDGYYTPEVSFSYRIPPATNQPELLMISIPRSSYTKPQLDNATAEQGEEMAEQPRGKSIQTSTSTRNGDVQLALTTEENPSTFQL